MGPQEFTMLCVYILSGILGLCVGSYLNVVIYRLPNEMNLSKPGSHCTKCNYSLKWYDNIPVLSYLILGGKCRKCKSPISPRYMIVELFNAALWLLSVALYWEASPVYACAVAVCCSARGITTLRGVTICGCSIIAVLGKLLWMSFLR